MGASEDDDDMKMGMGKAGRFALRCGEDSTVGCSPQWKLCHNVFA